MVKWSKEKYATDGDFVFTVGALGDSIMAAVDGWLSHPSDRVQRGA